MLQRVIPTADNNQELVSFVTQQPARKLTRIQSSKERGNSNLHHNNNLLAQKMNRAKDQKDRVIKRAYSKKGIIDWELEYNEAIKAKTKEAAIDIFDACD